MNRIIHPNFSVDCVIFGFDFSDLNVILVERNLDDPNNGKRIISDYTLAGNHVYEDEHLDEAARRVLKDLTGLENIYLEQFFTTSNPDRLSKHVDQLWLRNIGKDPTARVISVCYFSLLNCKEIEIIQKDRNVKWYPVNKVKNLAFDHDTILRKGLAALRRKLQHEPIGFEMLPPKFTLSQLQKLYEVVFGTEFDKRNFRKKISKMKYLEQLDEKQQDVSHKPARYYTYNKDVYESTKSDVLNFSI